MVPDASLSNFNKLLEVYESKIQLQFSETIGERFMLRFWKIAAKYLNLDLFATRDLRIRIVERPGIWMNREDLDRMLADLRTVADAVLAERELSYGVLTEEKDRLDNVVVTLLHDRHSGRPVAFNALSIMPVQLRGRNEEVLHLGLVMVDPGFRSKGMSWILYGLTCMLLFFRNQLRPIWISNVTQVPAIVGMVAESFANVFPTPDPSSRRTYDHLVLAREIIHGHRSVFGVGDEAGFDFETFVITDSYTGGSDHLKKSFDETAKHRVAQYNEMCRTVLDYQRGDDFLQLGQFNLAMARRLLLKSVPTASLPSVLYQAGFLLLGSVVLPVVHWLTPSQMMGELRPWKK